jgi:hypothetical protein
MAGVKHVRQAKVVFEECLRTGLSGQTQVGTVAGVLRLVTFQHAELDVTRHVEPLLAEYRFRLSE